MTNQKDKSFPVTNGVETHSSHGLIGGMELHLVHHHWLRPRELHDKSLEDKPTPNLAGEIYGYFPGMKPNYGI
jgi:hypothetical protein